MPDNFSAPSAAAYTLGCKVNQYDTAVILRALAERGFRIREFDEHADVYIINTCTVTNISDKKSRQIINRARKKNPNAIIAACGCYAQTDPATLRDIPGVSFVIGAREKERIADEISRLFVLDRNTDSGTSRPAKTGNKTRAYLKIQDGCDRFCTYCIVPYARGQVRSKLPEEAAAEAEALVAEGTQEIVLAGIHAASYGKDLISGGRSENLVKLMKRIHGTPGLKRLRLSSIEPYAVNGSFLEAVAELPKLCPHFHLSLQSGCDATLSRMNRRYTAAQYEEAVQNIRRVLPRAALTTDIIVGFPGETDDDFCDSLRFVEKINFSGIHVFMYSPKKGTPAAEFPDQIPERVKEERSLRMREAGRVMTQRYYETFVGADTEVLFETVQNNYWEGRTREYLTVRAAVTDKTGQSTGYHYNEIQTVHIDSAENGIAYGTIYQH